MASSEIIPFNSGSDVPAHLADVFGDGNIASRLSIDQLSYRGKVWRRIVGGEETQLTKMVDGDSVPVPIVNIVVLDHNKGRSRAFYPGQFEEGKNAAPTCYSGDGVTPDADVKEPCAKTCATCPNAVKGSKITESGKQSTLCSPFKRVAVVPTGALAKHPVMLLRLAQTSVWDKDNGENEAKGWYAWDQYLDMLRSRGAKHTAAVETKVKFDLRMAYPKLLFSAARWLNPEEATAAKGRLASDAETIEKILSGDGGKDGVAGTPATLPASVDDDAPAVDAAAQAAEAAAKVEAAKKEAAAKAKAAKVAAAQKAAADAAAAVAAAEADEGDDGGAWGDTAVATPAATTKPVTQAKAAAAPAAAAATPVAETAAVVDGTPAGLADLLNSWDA